MLLVALAACSGLPVASSDIPPTSTVEPVPGIASSSPTPSDAASPTASGPGAPSATSSTASAGPPQEAARQLLAAAAADVEYSVVREKGPTDPVETLIIGNGRVEPATGRGRVRYDLAGLFARPGPSASPSPLDVVDVIWTTADMYVRTDVKEAWQSRTRARGRTTGGLLGRLPDEVLGLVTLVAQSDPDRTTALEPTSLGGEQADRWVVTVPLEAVAAAGVPAEMPDAEQLRRVYGISELGIEVWLVENALRRVRIAFHRDAAPYGGPDLTTTTYDWSPASDAVPIAIPD